jgi:hypothetical protein
MALYYWVGGTNTWNSTATGKWSNASGVTPATYTTNPGAADDVFFDGFSPAGTVVTLSITANVRSITFTGFNGCTFTFGGNLTIGAGGLTLGANTTYLTSGAVTTYTVTLNATSTITSNGKILPTNLSLGGSGTTFTFAGNADFEGNLITAATAHNIKAATLTTVNLRIGGNISLLAITINATDHVTIKGYGTSKTYVSGSSATNIRCSFVSGSTYTSSGNSGLSGTSFLTVEALGQFNAVSTHTFSNNGTTYLSGFNASNNSDFFAYTNGNLVLFTDIVIKSYIQIQTIAMTITSTAGSRLLLEGNFTNIGTANCTIDILEFSGSTTSTVSATTTTTNIQIKSLTINKTGGGSVVFSPINANPLILYTPGLQTSSWTHTSGTIIQSINSIIRIQGQNDTSQFNFSTSVPSFSFSNLQIYGGKINLSSQLKCTRLSLNCNTTTTEFLSPTLFGFTADRLNVSNIVNSGRIIILKSGVTYTINTDLTMLGNLGGSSISLRASLVNSTKAIFNLEPGGTQTVESISPTDIDSSGNNNVGPPVKETIYSLNGTLLRTFNWSTGNQPPPVGAKITVGYTFVN